MARITDDPGVVTTTEKDPIDVRRYFLSRFGTPPAVPSSQERDTLTAQARKEAQSGYTHEDSRLEQYDRGTYNPLTEHNMALYGVPYNPYATYYESWMEPEDPANIAPAGYVDEYIERESVTRQFSQFTGDEHYSGGSEQAALGVYNQQLANLGMLSGDELGFLGLTPTDQMSYILSPADVRRLTSEDPAESTYAGNLRDTYGDDWFEQLYEIDEDTGWATLISYGDVDDDVGGWGGYGGGGYGGGYGGTYQAAARNGLINWRIGF